MDLPYMMYVAEESLEKDLFEVGEAEDLFDVVGN